MRKRVFLIVPIVMFLQSCNSQVATMYSFSYFEGTPVRELARAVEREDTTLIKRLAIDKRIDINYKEKKYDGNTLLITAVSNGKLRSVRALLELGADINYVNNSGKAAIHSACNFPSREAKSLEILKLLLDFSANPNHIQYGTGVNKGYVTTPLTLATYDSACANLLLKRGADLYFKANNIFIVWDEALLSSAGDGIFFLNDIIIKKKAKVPKVISYDVNNSPNDIFGYLQPDKFSQDPYNTKEKSKARNDILLYLKQIDFPTQQVYRD